MSASDAAFKRHATVGQTQAKAAPSSTLIGSTVLLGSSLLLQAFPAQAQVTAPAATPADAAEVEEAADFAASTPAEPAKTAPAAKPVQIAQADDAEAIDEASLDTVVIRAKALLAEKQDVPASISVVTGEDLQALGADSLREITRRASNISRANTSNARSQALVVRGIGRRGSTEAQDATVGTVVDGIPYAYVGLTAWDFVDIDTVEVARGPQGTAGAMNPSWGQLTLNTKRPTFEPTTDWSLRTGQRDTLFGAAAFGGPVIDKVLAYRGTFYVNNFQGPYSNAYWNGNQTYTDRLKISGKGQLLLKPTANYTVHLSADLQPKSRQNDNGLNFFHAPPATYTNGDPVNLATDSSTRLARRWFGQLTEYSYQNDYLNYRTGLQNNDSQFPLITGTRGVGLTQTWNVSDSSTLTSITGWRDLDFEARNDEGTPFDISTQGGGGVRFQQFSQELRLASSFGKLVDYTTGLFYIHHTYEVDSKTGWGDDAGAWFANKAQYDALDVDGDGRYLLNQSLSGLRKLSTASIDNDSAAIFGNATWHLTEKASLVTGLRVTKEDRKTDVFSLIESNGLGGGLNASISSFGVALGGFDSYFNSTANAQLVRDGFVVAPGTPGAVTVASQGYALTTDTTDTARLASATAAANAAALKYFRVATWDGLSNAQKKQLAYAQAIRKSQIGQIYNTLVGEPFKETQYTFVVSPSYKINDQLSTYVSYQHGEKAGIAQVINGNSLLADGESGNHYELGLKTNLLDETLQFNVDVFLSRLKNYQQSSAVVDTFTTNFNNDGTTYYTTVAANVPRIQVHGLELDGSYSGIKYVNLTLSAAYNVARYKEFPNAPQTPEGQYPATTGPNGHPAAPAFQDLSGEILPGAAKYTANLGAEFRYPFLDGKYIFHTDGNFNYTSRYNSDITLSSYSWIDAYTIVDFGIGIGRKDRLFDVTLLAKNLFDAEGKAYNWLNGTLDTTPRWVGAVVSGRF